MVKLDIRFGSLTAALFLGALPAHSQWYAGASGGASRASLDRADRSEQLADLGFLNSVTTSDERDTMFRVHGGYRLHRYLAVEVGYTDLGKFRLSSTVLPAGSLETSIRSDGPDISAVGLLPLNEGLQLFARVGGFNARTKASYASGGSVRLIDGGQEQTHRSTKAVYGVGVMYELTRNLGLRAEWTRYGNLGGALTGGEHDADAVSAGVQWRF